MLKSILILDDDQGVLEMLTELLTGEGYIVNGYAYTPDIFQLINQYEPDMIIVDYLMNGINGGEICAQVKKNESTAGIPVFLISGYEKVVRSLGDYRSDFFFPKPLNIPMLLKQLKLTSCPYV